MRKILFSIGFFVFFFGPIFAFANSHGVTGGLVPACEGLTCQACDLAKLFDNILKFSVYFSSVIATLMFAYAGFLYVTAAANPENINKAKSIFGKVFLGFVFVLSAWLIVNVLMNVFLDTGKIKYPWNEIQCAEFDEITIINDSPRSIDSNIPSNTPGVPGLPPEGTGVDTFTAGTRLGHDDAKERLEGAGIEVTSTSGPSGVQPNCSGAGCTSLTGIQERVVDTTVNLKEGCGESCKIVVTGGTEGGVHEDGDRSHKKGFKIDLDNTTSLNNYIKNSGRFTRSGSRNGRPVYKDGCGNIYVQESTHWDITVTQKCRF